MPEKKIALILGYECNNNCIFCYAADKKDFPSMTTEQAKIELKKGIDMDCTFVDFNGGEPTIRKDFFELVKYAKILGYRTIAVTTNGRMFSYQEFARVAVKAGLNHAIFSIHGHNAELHDKLVGVKGAFEQIVTGLTNFRKAYSQAYICTNTVITKLNYNFLPVIAENNIKFGANGCEFIFVHPRGNALKNFDEIVPTFTEVSEVVSKTIDVGMKHGISHFYMRYFPLCHMYRLRRYLSELDALSKIKEHHVGPEFQDFNVEEGRKLYGRVKGPQCKACTQDDICEGIFKEIAERRGFDELVPIA